MITYKYTEIMGGNFNITTDFKNYVKLEKDGKIKELTTKAEILEENFTRDQKNLHSFWKWHQTTLSYIWQKWEGK